MTIIPITSAGHLNTLLSTNTYVVLDFYADWCGPCKAIAPIFSHLATAESKPGRMAFGKVDVDSQQGIARTYSVTAMPTFLILKNGKVVNTLRGADPSSLRSAVLSASADAARGAAKASAVFTSKGHVLGSESASSKQQQRPRPNNVSAAPATDPISYIQRSLESLMRQGVWATIIRFVGLYLVTLFSLDPHSAAEASQFNLRNSNRR